MSCWYSLSGCLKVHDSEEVQAIVEEFEIESVEITIDYSPGFHGDNLGSISIEGGSSMNHARPAELDNILQKLGKHVVDPTFVEWDYENEKGKLYIGPPEKQAEAVSQDALNQIRSLLEIMTPADRQSLALHLELLKGISLDSGKE